jgi:anti-sigma regulatory factor (Ser/Thr protein kinase)
MFLASLGDRLPRPVLEDMQIVASELVSNSYKYAGNPVGFPIEVSVDVGEDRARLEVIDHSIFDPTPETTQELREVKWGLFLVDRITADWGRISEGGIWAEFSFP